MGLGRNQLAISKLSPEKNLVLAAVPVVLDDVIQKDRATVVVAEEIQVNSQVRSAGFPVTLRCRTLTFAAGASINTTGLSSAVSYDAGMRPEAAHDPGAPGANGKDGGRGMDGGAIDIVTLDIIGDVVLIANGGAGGRAQDGGNGRDGSRGPDGATVTQIDDTNVPPECHGRAGTPGGAVGLPGYRGSGGAGGNISLLVLENPGRWKIDLAANGGAPGDAGAPGAPGEGGEAGNAGVLIVKDCEYDYLGPIAESALSGKLEQDLHAQATVQAALFLNAFPLGPGGPGPIGGGGGHSRCTIVNRIPGNRAPQAARGDLQVDEVQKRQQAPATASAGKTEARQLSAAEFAACFDGPVIDLITSATEDTYRQAGNNISDSLRKSINFLLTITTEDLHPSPIKQEAMTRAYSMARKQALGLDFFGYTLERTPLLSFNTYSGIINGMVLPQAQSIENAFFAYWDAQSNVDAQRSAIRNMQVANQQKINSLNSEFDRSKAEVTRQLNDLKGLDARYDAAYQFLLQSKKELDAAISAKHNKCHLISTLTAVGTIVIGVSTGGTGFIAAASAGAKLYDDFSANDSSLSKLWDNRKLLQGDFKDLAEGAKDITEAIEKIDKAVTQLKPDEQKLPQFKMERDAFDKVAKDFADIPQAAAYKEAGYDFLKAAETRNQAIVDYNAGLVQLIDLKAKLLATVRIGNAFDSNLNSLGDPGEAHIIAMMSRLYLDTLSLAAQMVHAEKKALAYHFARPTQAPISALNVAAITGSHQRIVLEDWVSAKERYAARRKLNPGALRLGLKSLVSNDAWGTFKKTGMLNFTVRRDHPTYQPLFEVLPGLRLTGMDLLLNDIKVAPNLQYIPWTMTQMGNEQIYHADGSSDAFSHRTVQFSGATQLNGGLSIVNPDFSEDNLYAGLSPFAAWMLVISQNPSLKIDMSGLKDVVLILDGYTLDS